MLSDLLPVKQSVIWLIDDWLLITDGVHTENADDTEVRRRTEEENGN